MRNLSDVESVRNSEQRISLYPNDAHKAAAIPNAKQIEAAATGNVGNGKLGFVQKRLYFRIETYGFGTHFPWPLRLNLPALRGFIAQRPESEANGVDRRVGPL